MLLSTLRRGLPRPTPRSCTSGRATTRRRRIARSPRRIFLAATLGRKDSKFERVDVLRRACLDTVPDCDAIAHPCLTPGPAFAASDIDEPDDKHFTASPSEMVSDSKEICETMLSQYVEKIQIYAFIV